MGNEEVVIRQAEKDNIERITDISKRAFLSDTEVGNPQPGGPPEYDNADWHREMMRVNNLYEIVYNDKLIGGAILMRDNDDRSIMYLGRIFIDPQMHKKGLGLRAMMALEAIAQDVSVWRLDTPLWNVRTNAFYKKLGYQLASSDKYFAYYEKITNNAISGHKTE